MQILYIRLGPILTCLQTPSCLEKWKTCQKIGHPCLMIWGIGPISSSESALKLACGNVGGTKKGEKCVRLRRAFIHTWTIFPVNRPCICSYKATYFVPFLGGYPPMSEKNVRLSALAILIPSTCETRSTPLWRMLFLSKTAPLAALHITRHSMAVPRL